MRMMRKVTVLSVCAALLAALPAAAAETIKIGAILAVTGPAAFLGAPEAKTLEMLAAQVNAAGGIKGMKVELLIKDSAGERREGALARQAARRGGEGLRDHRPLDQRRVDEDQAVHGRERDAAALLRRRRVDHEAGAEVGLQDAPERRATPCAGSSRDLKKKGLTKIGVLASNTGFGKAGKEQLEKLAPEFGIEIVIAEVYDTTAVDLDAEVTKLKAKDVQAVVNWSIEPAQSKVPVSMRKMGWNVPLYQSHGFGNIKYVEAAGPAAEGILFPAGRLLVADVLAGREPAEGAAAQVQEGLRGS